MDFIVKDLEKYKRAKKRAEALGLTQYIAPLQNIIRELERIAKIDEKFISPPPSLGRLR